MNEYDQAVNLMLAQEKLQHLIQLAQGEPVISHHFGGGVYAKAAHAPAGMVLVQHKHVHDHLSILASGTVEVVVDNERREITAPACLTIEAGKHHGIKALTDVVWYCIHATDCTDAEQVDNVLITPSDQADMKAMAEGML